VGTDAIDLEAAKRLGITIRTTSEEVVEPVAQMTVAMILALARNLPQHGVDFRQGLWRKAPGVLLSEWTIGLVGFGRIGRAVERYLRPFGPEVLVTDPAVGLSQLPPGVEACDLPTLLTRSDLVSIHATRRPEEGILISQTELDLMKPGARLVNTARGHLVDEWALLRALESGHLAGAALDVFETEPYTGRLAQLPQVLLTPHVASLTRASRVAMEIRCVTNMVDFFRG
jgi:D-3-phosphoglycerate dehydrogenase